MSAILSADDLNDFISPGVACIKPVETLPKPDDLNPYEVTTEDKVQAQNPAPASISLTDCLACSGCVTSAEAVLVSLQSHTEVLNTLDGFPSLNVNEILDGARSNASSNVPSDAKLFVASVSPQVRASLAATFGMSQRRAGNMIEQFLSGAQGLRLGGKHNSDFAYVVDTNRMREVSLVLAADEVASSISSKSAERPLLTSACPGWVCYAEKTHPHVLPHLSALKSPQALTGTILKSVLSKRLGIHPSQIWHLAVMPCFDKKLEASREELTHKWWSGDSVSTPVRDVDCVITSRELLTLAEARGVSLLSLQTTPVSGSERTLFPDPSISSFLLSPSASSTQSPESGSSGGYLTHVMLTQQSLYPGSTITARRGRNADVVEYTLDSSSQDTIFKCARYYGFKNIQNLVRKLQPARQSKLPGAVRRNVNTSPMGSEYAYIEVMACPGGCTNGGGQVRIEDVANVIPQTRGEIIENKSEIGSQRSQKEWLARVDEAYYSAGSESDLDFDSETSSASIRSNGTDEEQSFSGQEHDGNAEGIRTNNIINNINTGQVARLLAHWSNLTEVSIDKLTTTTFRKVESDVGKSTKKSTVKKMGDSERIAAIAGLQGGGW